MTKSFIIAIIVILLFIASLVHAQSTVNSPTERTLKGYFILFRNNISNPDKDYVPTRDAYAIYYAKNLDTKIITSFSDLDSFDERLVRVSDPLTLFVENQSQNHKIDSAFKRRGINRYIPINTPIFNLRSIPHSLVDADEKYLSVFYGSLAGIGPFLTTDYVFKTYCRGYYYFNDKVNKLTYLYSIVF